jgi:(p)ppGpp synthase/HD superfamily hydrolase
MTIIDSAIRIAVSAHWEQKRKSGNTPYIVHPVAVGVKLSKYGFRDAVVAAGILHDVIEDTKVTEPELRTQVGDDITDMVLTLSEDKSLAWEERKRAYTTAVSNASDEVKAIATADKVSNLSETLDHFRENPTEFWSKFTRGLPEQRWFYRTFMTDVGARWSHPLMDELKVLVEEFEKD